MATGASRNDRGRLVSTGSNSSRSLPADTGRPYGTYFLGRYRVVDEIGVGGMASVHLARMDGPAGFQKWVAIKRIHPSLVDDDTFIQSFIDEARIAAQISHANVAQVFDLGRDANTYWIAMEYLHGEPLRELMRRAEEGQGMMPTELAARIISDAAEGLHAAHELRDKDGRPLELVHRDVTPHNLFLTYDGMVKVVDFGIAKIAGRQQSTRAGTLKGKIAYMSPEQVRGVEVDRRTDVFALGVVLWELTTGRRLFRMETDLDTLERVQACIVPPPSSVIPGYPPELESIVMRALARGKEARFQTARELSRALQAYLVRRGMFVGPEEIAAYLQGVFADRVAKREQHLRWAAEVTQTISLDHLQEPDTELDVDEDLSLVSYSSDSNVQRRPPRGEHASTSTAVEAPPRSLSSSQRSLPGGAPPAAWTPPPDLVRSAARPAVRPPVPPPAHPPPARPPPTRPPTLTPANAPLPSFENGFDPSASLVDDEEEIKTVTSGRALDQGLFGAKTTPAMAPAAYPQFPPLSASSLTPHPSQIQAAPGWSSRERGIVVALGGLAVAALLGIVAILLLRPVAGPGAGVPVVPPNGSIPLPATASPTARVEAPVVPPAPRTPETTSGNLTPDSLPLAADDEPEPAATEAPAPPVPVPVPVPVPAPAPAPAPVPVKTPKAVAERPAPAPRPTPADTVVKAKEAPGGPTPGYLTVVCVPFCDSVVDGGRSLGPSPVVHVPLSPGEHRISLKKAGMATKVISVIIVAGQVSSRRERME